MVTGRLALAIAALLAAVSLCPAPTTAGHVDCEPSPLEIVFAIDASRSLGIENFNKLKQFVKEIAEHLPIGEKETRPAVVSFADVAKVEVDLGEANDVETFKKGVEATPYYKGFTVIGEAMQVARTKMFPKSRPGVAKLLLVITDGNPTHWDRDETALVRVESEAYRKAGIRVHAVGIGKAVRVEELKQISTSGEYSLVNDFEGLKALLDSLVKDICSIRCVDLGEESFPGQCFNGTQRIVNVKKTENKELKRCEKTISYEYKYCGTSHLCKDAEVKIEPCVNGVRRAITTWEDFDVSLQKCVVRSSVQELDCKAIEECREPVADIVFILDCSVSIGIHNWRLQLQFLRSMVESMKVGPGAIHIGVVVFGTGVWRDIPLGSVTSKLELLGRIDSLQHREDQLTNIGGAIRTARQEFANSGRAGVSHIAMLLTDGENNLFVDPVKEASLLESTGATVMAVGIGYHIKKEELKAIATPPLTEHLFYAEDYISLLNWASKISEGTCHSITPPDPSLCDLPPKRLVSECYKSLQKITELKYEYDAQGRCTKKVESRTISPCKVLCTDPINGNEYYEGERWTTECATFECRRPDSQSSVFGPIAQECPGTEKCQGSGSDGFKCHDERGLAFSRCSCQGQRGNPLLNIITADANASP